MITGHGMQYSALETFHKGAWDYIEKPFYPNTILMSVQRALEKRKSNMEKIELLKEMKAKGLKLEKTLMELKQTEAKLVQSGKLAAKAIRDERNFTEQLEEFEEDRIISEKLSQFATSRDLKSCIIANIIQIKAKIKSNITIFSPYQHHNKTI